ncbi:MULTISPECIES: hypothetical protein [Streptomyces]|jgi:hypothetical protein|uniref:Uncharacterized protein n=1 Tax=Streptomyces thermoviolaceus subsp. thermoviolaceus TaxID=66860 RepID=A0ABX0YXX7_STRTL|nr:MULTISPECIES: hypothetical protein [Streptomyces]MCM3266662.1 hypothetical protein [Streptomyces thermoviolaceus]NJP16041.1 hypothetical protein [Streptomyces thermoviolaceus subsp. thermoviolaceus]RSR99938.1 hypothetical protein EF917_18000 [Streptomyces sp. WAC00469]WTD48230.1 hypothetical protein OG899_12285 [Streptomyces thermoviolaceus]GGV70627.1 hypothetical protein GCM10010499_20340 [Streptomyces thermoviolaceus subsp. apingens]
MSAVSYSELGELTGELLPERMLLSIIDVHVDNSRTYVFPAQGNGGGGESGGTTVAYACQATESQGTPGLLGALGLGSSPSSSMTCVPATVVTH